jgi:predicted RNase H-like HicB family nuclease
MEPTDPTRYVVAIHRASGVYYARVVNLPGCISKGASEVEALENARSTIRAYLALARLAASEAPSVSVEISA